MSPEFYITMYYWIVNTKHFSIVAGGGESKIIYSIYIYYIYIFCCVLKSVTVSQKFTMF